MSDLLSVTVTTGGPTAPAQLAASGLNMTPDFLKSQPLGDPVQAATCFVIHSSRGIESFPTIVIRIWPSVTDDKLWIAVVPEVAHGGQQVVAGFLAPWLFRVFGPFQAFRQSTLEEAATIAETTGRLFVALAEQYLEIIDDGLDPADSRSWQNRKLSPAELVAPALQSRGDTEPPDLRSFSFIPSVVDVAASAAIVTCRARIVDDLAGVAGEGYTSSASQARFRSPSGQLKDVVFDHRSRVSGDTLDGTYEARLSFSPEVERGFWVVEYVLVADQVGNTRFYRDAELRDLGFPTRLEVR
jgi:hypothetical protein